MKDRIVPLILAVAGAVLAVGMLTFAGPCVHDDGTAAMCVAASQMVLACGAVALIAGLISAAVRNVSVQMVLSIIGIVSGVLAIAAPGGILPLCMMQTMRCWTIMKPFAMVIGGVIVIVSLVLLFQVFARRRQANKALRRMAR